ncbi:MAG TPA: isoprenylcysteine carboxylmethyltransferase family protein [Candidatus Methylomirabilis sp.]|nr:isoprenylcysteine carboxylmethyltransferase family protein [Candidatus Methylomirabilis sp.]
MADTSEQAKRTRKLGARLVAGAISNALIYGVPLFLAAWTWNWWRAWVVVAVALLGTIGSLVSLSRASTGLLEERLKLPVQKGQPVADRFVLILLFATYFGLLVFIPLDVFRLHLMSKPGTIASRLGLVLFLVGFWIAHRSLRENAFAAPVIKHQEERKHAVVDTGVYSILRHPMYLGGVILVVGLPLWLESYAGALLAAVPMAVLAARILIEERFLRRELAGYEAYTQKVRFRLIPYVW